MKYVACFLIKLLKIPNRISVALHTTWIKSCNVWLESSIRFRSRFNRIAIWFRASLIQLQCSKQDLIQGHIQGAGAMSGFLRENGFVGT